MTNPLLVTLGLDAATFARLDALRDQYFPPERNVVPAHISLFHHLPGVELETIEATLAQVADDHAPLAITFAALKKTGRGMAASVDAPGLSAIHAALAREFRAWLTPQDRQPFRPHVTIMNKAEPHQAALAYADLSARWARWEGTGESLLLWEYRGGPWRLITRYPFTPA